MAIETKPQYLDKQSLKIEIFISHSSQDTKVAEALVELLRNALDIPPAKIRCTSVDGYKLDIGTQTDEQLRKEIYESIAFIGLITQSSIQSAYVLFELGARWGGHLHLSPVLAAGAGPSLLRGPLSGLNALSCDNPADIQQLISNTADTLGRTIAKPSAYQKYVDGLVRQSQRDKRKVRKLTTSELPDSLSKIAQKPKNIKYYFLAGCAVGNKIALLPIPPNPDNNTRELDELLESLKKIEFGDKSIISALLKVKNRFAGPTAAGIQDHDARVVIEQFLAAISAIPEVVQNRSSEEEFQWFKFGQLIYEVGTVAVVNSEDDRSINALIIALESLAGRMSLPSNLSQEIAKFIRAARTKKSKNQIYENANRIALAVFALH